MGRQSGACKCGSPIETQSGYCLTCHAAYMREWRKTHPLTPEQRRKASARAYARVYEGRGKLTKGACERCGGTDNIERHHPDYSQPLVVRYLCRRCHRIEHATGH